MTELETQIFIDLRNLKQTINSVYDDAWDAHEREKAAYLAETLDRITEIEEDLEAILSIP
jgi:hypothetical protein